MSGLLNLGSTSLLAFQNALSVTSNNIANVNTPGYSRQTVHLSDQDYTHFSNFSIGNGVKLSSIERMSDVLLQQQLSTSYSTQGGYQALFEKTNGLCDSLSIGESSLSNSIQSFYNALNALGDSPNFTAGRQSFLTQSQLLIGRFEQLDAKFKMDYIDLSHQLGLDVSKINVISNSLAELNANLVGVGDPDPNVLDRRDNLILELSKLVNVNVMHLSDGTVSVSVGTGQSLVTGASALQLSVRQSDSDPLNSNICISGNGGYFDITSSLSGGEIGGLLSYRDTVLSPTYREIGRMELALVDHFNAQHKQGMDLNDKLGGNFFTDINTARLTADRVLPNLQNSGNMAFTVNISDVEQLTASDYSLVVGVGPSYALTRLSDNTSFTISSFPYSIDGLVLNTPTGLASAGDSFIISPTRGANDKIGLVVNSIQDLALASPVRARFDLNNTGSGLMSDLSVLDTSNAVFSTPQALTPPMKIVFLTSTTYQIQNTNDNSIIEGPITYDSTQTSAVFPTPGGYDPGIRLNLSGNINAGDSFYLEYNLGGVGDGTNAMALCSQSTLKMIEGTSSVQENYANIVTYLGSAAEQSAINLEASDILAKQSLSRVDSLSGVNLDEETANLLKYQQAYQAATRLISVANAVFDSLMQAMR